MKRIKLHTCGELGRIDPSSKIGLDLVFGRGLEGRVAGLLEKVFRPTLKIRHALI